MRQQRRLGHDQAEQLRLPSFDRPVFIVSAPRAGSTLLFETLAQFPTVWTIGQESHDIEHDVAELHPATYHYASNRLTAAEATPAIYTAMQHWFSQRLQNRAGLLYQSASAEEQPAAIRFLEKTPKNALRIPFLKAIFPDARFIFLYREPPQNISSLLEGWRSRRFIAYRHMPGWPYTEWSFLLIPDWEALIDRPLVEIAARQWEVANTTIIHDLEMLDPAEWCFVHYNDLIQQPQQTVRQIGQFAGWPSDDQIEQRLAQALPITHLTLSAPSADKWRQHEAEITPILASLEPVISRVNDRGMSQSVNHKAF
ncbi:MAG: sulfotransferase [Chloroflexaceae bacterium]|nr:sulfotransferase [Chloroflexaceae bacterium]